MFCSKCGNEIAEGAAFCPKCGTKVVNVGDGQQPMDIPVPDVKNQQTSEAVKNTQQDRSDNTAKVKGNLRKAATIGRVLMWGSLLLLMPFWPLRINPAILVSIAAIGMILSVFGRKPLELSTKIQVVVGVILLVVIIVTSVKSSGQPGMEVRAAYLTQYSDKVTIEEAFDNFFYNGKWSKYEEVDYTYVVFTGVCEYSGDRVDVKITFKVTGENFIIDSLDMNGQAQDDFMLYSLLTAVYEDY